MNYLPAYRLKLYRNFKAIEDSNFHGIVRYYEQFEEDIRNLDFEEHFDCTLAYTNALFEIGSTGKHLVMCDYLLEVIIMENVETWGGQDVYERILFSKSASIFQLCEYAKAEYILREIIKLNPRNPTASLFLQKCLYMQKPAWLFKTRAIFIAMVLLGAISIAAEIMIMRPFYPNYLYITQNITYSILCFGVGIFAIGEAAHSWRCQIVARKFARHMLHRKLKQGI